MKCFISVWYSTEKNRKLDYLTYCNVNKEIKFWKQNHIKECEWSRAKWGESTSLPPLKCPQTNLWYFGKGEAETYLKIMFRILHAGGVRCLCREEALSKYYLGRRFRIQPTFFSERPQIDSFGPINIIAWFLYQSIGNHRLSGVDCRQLGLNV